MRVDFYQLGSQSAVAAITLLARKTIEAGERLLVVSAVDGQLQAIGKGLWESSPDAFLANGRAGGGHDSRQPILLSDSMSPTNRARFVLLADGQWRDPFTDCLRAMLLFDDTTVAGARETWKMLGEREGVERKFWKQQGGRWVEGP